MQALSSVLLLGAEEVIVQTLLGIVREKERDRRMNQEAIKGRGDGRNKKKRKKRSSREGGGIREVAGGR